MFDIIPVSILACPEYSDKLVYDCIKKSIENIGGMEKYITPGETVLLKVNMLMKKKPEDATTTHPVFVKALARLLVEYGAIVVIGDSPGGPFNETMLKPQYDVCGYRAAAEESGASLNYNTAACQVKNPDGRILKHLAVTEMAVKADKIISVSKLKTHGMMSYTGAVKNMFGIIPGITKADYHLKMPDWNDFADVLIDICAFAKPVLSFMDAIVGMEGDGPSSGTPRQIGAVLASPSPYHLDVVASHIIGLPPEAAPTIRRSLERNLAVPFGEIPLSGDPIDNFVIQDYAFPEHTKINPLSGKFPKFIESFMSRHFKPKLIFDHGRCVGCGDCAANCPPGAIAMKNGKPEIDTDKCILCLCCQELCPVHAVKAHTPQLYRRAFQFLENHGSGLFAWYVRRNGN